MNQRTAIRECKQMWAEIEKSGRSKRAFLRTPAGKAWEKKGYWLNCPLCEYTTKLSGCYSCPLVWQFNQDCIRLGFTHQRACPDFWAAVKKLKVQA